MLLGCVRPLRRPHAGGGLRPAPVGGYTVGLTAGASAPPQLVDGVIDALRAFGPVEVEEIVVNTETVRFAAPRRPTGSSR